MVDEERKSDYWNHFTSECQKSFRPKKITDLRLNQIKETVLDDDFLWQAIFVRHNASDKTPNELKETQPSDYEQARADFWALIREKIQRQLTRRGR